MNVAPTALPSSPTEALELNVAPTAHASSPLGALELHAFLNRILHALQTVPAKKIVRLKLDILCNHPQLLPPISVSIYTAICTAMFYTN